MYQGHNKTQETDFAVPAAKPRMPMQKPHGDCDKSGYGSQQTKNGCDFKALGMMFPETAIQHSHIPAVRTAPVKLNMPYNKHNKNKTHDDMQPCPHHIVKTAERIAVKAFLQNAACNDKRHQEQQALVTNQ